MISPPIKQYNTIQYNTMTDCENYWIGPYGVLIPNNIDSVIARDGGNILYKNGSQTNKLHYLGMNEKEYKESYAKFNPKDEKWYYIGEFYWMGPYGILVRNYLNTVIAADGRNTLYKDGRQTMILCDSEMSEQKYKDLYAKFKHKDAKWHYIGHCNWIGPYGILVPNEIESIVGDDGCNILSKYGPQTEIYCEKRLSEAKYKKLYAKFDAKDGKWYYQEPKQNHKTIESNKQKMCTII